MVPHLSSCSIDAYLVDLLLAEYYTMLASLYGSLGIPYQTSENSISYSTLASAPSTPFSIPKTFPHNSAVASSQSSSSLPDLPKQTPYFSFSCYSIPILNRTISLPDFLYRPSTLLRSAMVTRDYIRFLVTAKKLAAGGHLLTFGKGQMKKDSPIYGWTLGEFFEREGYGREFAKDAFAPLFSGVCTCSFDDLMAYPAAVVLGEYLCLHTEEQKVLRAGIRLTLLTEYAARNMPFGKMSFVSSSVQAVCAALSKPIHSIFLSTPVASIHSSGKADLPIAIETESGEVRYYHHVIIATQANQAARLLRSKVDEHNQSLAEQVAVLERFPYGKSLVVCHTDEKVMPAERERWRCLNFAVVDGALDKTSAQPPASVSKPATADNGYDPTSVAQCTHFFNLTLPTLGTSVSYLQTTNPVALPDPSLTLSASWFERANVTLDSMFAVDDLDEVQGLGQRWFVGSYAYPGIPLLEGCVATAVRVARGIAAAEGVEVHIPWEPKTVEEKGWDAVLMDWVWWWAGILVWFLNGGFYPFVLALLVAVLAFR
ncbi:hypothetical protein HK104_002323 [Borealophlyctis nickersoniae]|nr:hypothetical protein HK104_002323 [Borealophlyctis nickersoniae]